MFSGERKEKKTFKKEKKIERKKNIYLGKASPITLLLQISLNKKKWLNHRDDRTE